jgi:hypothetical protein
MPKFDETVMKATQFSSKLAMLLCIVFTAEMPSRLRRYSLADEPSSPSIKPSL